MVRIGIDYYPEHWDRSLWEEDAARMEALGTHVVRIGEFAWSRMEPRDGEFDFGWLDNAIGPACQKLALERGGSYKITGWCDLIEPDTAQVLARYQGRFYSGVPAITKNRFGQGGAYYMGTIGEQTLYRTLMLTIFQEAEIPVIRLPQGVEATTRSGEGGIYQFFFNNTLHGQNIQLDSQRVHRAPLEMKIRTEGWEWV